MAEKQGLYDAFYGPSVLPTRQPHNRSGSRCGSSCCLFSFLLKLIISVVVIIGLAILIFWLVVRPHGIKVHVTEATLTRWNYTTANNTLDYNLALDISIRNPNKRLGVYYDAMEIRGVYKYLIFESKFVRPFYQGRKNTTVLSPVFAGQRQFGILSFPTMYQETRNGVYKITMDLDVRMRYRLGRRKTRSSKPRFICDLEVSLTNANGTSVVVGAAPFKVTKCESDG